MIGHIASFWVMAASLFVIGFTGGMGMVIWGTSCSGGFRRP